MPTSLTFDQYVSTIDAAGTRLVGLAVGVGLDAPVPTCPSWTARHLLAHVTMVHRWATAQVRGDDPSTVPDDTEIRTTVDDLPAYYRLLGHSALLAALRSAPPDLEAMTFLNDAPAPREFWARRQAHETTIHMVDAMAARVGRLPTSGEIDLEPALAVDGIDELLVGFYTRGRCKLYDGDEYTIAVVPTDFGCRWRLHVAPRLTVERHHEHGQEEDAAILTGTAVQLYLGLWNRGDEIEVKGRHDVIERWRASQRVSRT